MIQEQLQQEILTRIDKLAEKLGVTAEYLWPHLVRYEMAVGVSLIAATVVTMVITGFLWWAYNKWDEEMVGLAAFIGAVIAVILVLFSVTMGIPAIIAPEAAAFKALLP